MKVIPSMSFTLSFMSFTLTSGALWHRGDVLMKQTNVPSTRLKHILRDLCLDWLPPYKRRGIVLEETFILYAVYKSRLTAATSK